MNITLKDVAKQAGVSIAAASYALNGTGTISKTTRERVLQAAEELNYHPNAFARNLKSQKSGTIGIFITRFSGLFYEDILEGIHHTVLDTDFELIVCPESRPVNKHLTQRQVDGAIVFDSKISSDLLLNLASASFPIIVLDRLVDSPYLYPVLLDNEQGAKETFHHLYNQGARRIFYITGASDSLDNAERMHAFVDEAQRNDVAIHIYSGNFTQESGYDVGRLIVRSGDFPEAVFCGNDQMAIGLIKALNESHIRVPEDVAVVGFDDIPIAEYMQPSLTTVGYSRFSWGAQAAAQLIDFLRNGTPIQPVRIPAHLIPRDSSRFDIDNHAEGRN
jgi:LacI family transcriptional regulator